MARELPHDLDTERALIGGLLVDAERALPQTFEAGLRPGDFYNGRHGRIFKAALDLDGRRAPVDLVSLTAALKETGDLDRCGGPAYLSELADGSATAANSGFLARKVIDYAGRRAVIEAARKIAEHAQAESDAGAVIEAAENEILTLRDRRPGDRLTPLGAGGFVRQALTDLNERANGRGSAGVPSGFTRLDKLTSGGFHPGDLAILAGRPAMGKTALALTIAAHVAARGLGVVFFSLEMSRDQLLTRLLAGLAKVPISRIRTGDLAPEDWPKIRDAAARLQTWPLAVDESAKPTVSEIRGRTRQVKVDLERQGAALGLVVADYLQLVKRPRRNSRDEEIAEVSGALKALAKDLAVPVLALAQLNRDVEKRTDRRPILSDLRESGAIEQDADVVAFIYRDEVYTGKNLGQAELIVRKQRQGPTGTVPLEFQSVYGTFREP